jgi:hypothetical protein
MSIIYEYFNYYVYGVNNSESDKNKEIVINNKYEVLEISCLTFESCKNILSMIS